MTHQDLCTLNAARSAARAAGMFFCKKAGKFLLYREARPRNVFVGASPDAEELLRLVTRAATTAPARKS